MAGMSDTWRHTRDSVRRLKIALREADEDTRYEFAFWLSGLTLMAIAIIDQFGWSGALFCIGAIVWRAGTPTLEDNE